MSFESKLKELLNVDKLNLQGVSGGDINQAFKVETESKRYFLKYNSIDHAYPMFLAEKSGLDLLAKAGVLVPKPIDVFKLNPGAALLLDWVDAGFHGNGKWQEFGLALSKMHHFKAGNFGLDHDNYIGRLPQINTQHDDWLGFYASQRIEPQLRMAIDDGLIDARYARLSETVFSAFGHDLPSVSPALLHGDLWSGNLMFSAKGEAVFIDPAVYFGHREMDIAMMLLFGGFGPGLEVYQAIYPLEKNWEERLQFYQLYYILVHVNLFGGSYIGSAKRILEYYAR
jgi:protein-ribulosamine 3-kinase